MDAMETVECDVDLVPYLWPSGKLEDNSYTDHEYQCVILTYEHCVF